MTLRRLATEFATHVVAGNFEAATLMMSSRGKATWAPSAIQEEYEGMVEYFEGGAPRVEREFDMEPYGDDGTMWVYVPIVSEDESEAIIVGFDAEQMICDLEFGRP